MNSIWQKWQNKIEGLLSEKQLPNQELEFNHEYNFERLQIPSNEIINDPQEQMIILFSRLSLCYEFGLFLEQTSESNKYSLLFGFDHGNIFSFENTNTVRLPHPTPDKVLKLKSASWFKEWDIKGLSEAKDLTHLLLFPWPQMALILSTKLADPWLKFHIEKTFEYLRKP